MKKEHILYDSIYIKSYKIQTNIVTEIKSVVAWAWLGVGVTCRQITKGHEKTFEGDEFINFLEWWFQECMHIPKLTNLSL